MVSSAYLRLLIILLAVLIPACASSSPAFRMMYSAYKLNKQGDNIQPWHTPFPILNQFSATLMAESKEKLKSFLMKVKEESEKAGLKCSIQKTKIMASSPITSWQIDGETMKIVHTIFLGSKSTAYGDCSHTIRRHLPFGRKAMTNLDSILKSRDTTLLTKVCLVRAMVFPVVM